MAPDKETSLTIPKLMMKYLGFTTQTFELITCIPAYDLFS